MGHYTCLNCFLIENMAVIVRLCLVCVEGKGDLGQSAGGSLLPLHGSQRSNSGHWA